MKIVILNECFLSEGHLAELKKLGNVEIYNDTTTEDIAIARMKGAHIVFADMYECPLTQNVLSAAENLKLLCVNSTGFDLIDLETAKCKAIQVANTPGFSTEAVAEHTFALLLGLNRRIVSSDAAVRQQPFQINPANPEHYRYVGFNLTGKTLGIIGLGAIGIHVARIAAGFGMRIIGYNRHTKIMSGVESVDLGRLFAEADILSLHMPLNEQSHNIIDQSTIQKMKDGAIIINTARGGCIVSQDLAMALHDGKIAGAGLDTLEPWTLDNPLFKAPNTLITPHSAWFTQEALDNIGDIMLANVQAFVAGKPVNIVN